MVLTNRFCTRIEVKELKQKLDELAEMLDKSSAVGATIKQLNE